MSNLNIKEDMIVIALDGDGVGRLCGRAVIANDYDKLHEVSARIDGAQEYINEWAKKIGGIKISGGGDESCIAIPKDAFHKIEELRKGIEEKFGYTVSVGVGKDLAEAGTSLLVAKLRGKNRIVKYNKELHEDIKKAKRRVREKRATPDEYKLAEAYLKKDENMSNLGKSEGSIAFSEDCQYCNDTDGVDPDHCKYCHDAESNDGEEDCKYCAEMKDHNHADSDDCAYCKDATEKQKALETTSEMTPERKEGGTSSMGPTIKLPTTTSSQDYAGQDLDAPAIDKPDGTTEVSRDTPALPPDEVDRTKGQDKESRSLPPDEVSRETPNSPSYDAAKNPEMNDDAPLTPNEDISSKEAMQTIAEEIENDSSDPDKLKQIDDDQLPVGNEMEDGVSRPEDYSDTNDKDLGLSEEESEEPDLTDILKEGLDSHADNIQREKAIQMASEALQQFKECKEILEKAKEQAPQLYNSSILMLRAMIEMAKLLGLGQSESQEPQSAQEPKDDEWKEPFPKHPDQGGELKPGHAAPEGVANSPQSKADRL